MSDTHLDSGEFSEESGDEMLPVSRRPVAQVVILEDECDYSEAMITVVQELADRPDFPIQHYSFGAGTTRDDICRSLSQALVICGESDLVNPTTKDGLRMIRRLSQQGFVDILVFQLSPPEVTKIYDDIRMRGIWRILRTKDLFDRNIQEFRTALQQSCEFL